MQHTKSSLKRIQMVMSVFNKGTNAANRPAIAKATEQQQKEQQASRGVPSEPQSLVDENKPKGGGKLSSRVMKIMGNNKAMQLAASVAIENSNCDSLNLMPASTELPQK